MNYVFMSFASPHSGKNIGCCILQIEDPNSANDKAKELGLMPEECNHARGYALDEKGFKEQGMELNKFYSPKEMEKMGFEKRKEQI